MKVVIIGSTHAGTATIKSIKSHYPEAEIDVYEKNDNVSFLSCGIALTVQGEVKNIEDLFYSSPEILRDLGANIHMEHEVTAVDTANKTVTVTDLTTQTVTTVSYDKLVATTGSWPVVPPIPGIEDERIVLSKNYTHAKALISYANDPKIRRVVIIGGGYIGTELVEAFNVKGREVTLIDNQPTVLNRYFDDAFTKNVADLFTAHGVTVATGQLVQSFENTPEAVIVKTDQSEFAADLVVMSVGFRPNTQLFAGQLDMMPNGALLVNDYMQTSQPDVYAAGDSVAVHYNPTGENAYIPLATNAVRQGTLIGYNLVKPTVKYMGTQSTSGLKLYDLNMASSGLTEAHAKELGLDAASLTMTDNFRPEFMSSTAPVLMTITWEKTTQRILGVQLQSKYDISQSANTASVAIQNRMTLTDLAFVDMLFQPWFDRPFNYLNLLAQAALAQADKTDA
ncbi:NADH oxidase [Leuconostoc holzapfelii]|uniref:NADH oxidase n=1 Tax=Leuconostoc holzapfelii TaxID=434464 RepID=A0ABT2NX55_9LACO|nr:FAD-dependent oxidoreductase [Leuconostoc holzapfelii]MCT8389952.1 NADH oxidase [Leuconostoc holzapfelii]